MSAAATAAGYLYARDQLATSDHNSHRAAESQSSRRPEPKGVLEQDQSQPITQMRAPKIEYRKRRYYALPSVE